MKDLIKNVETFLSYSDDKLEELHEQNKNLKLQNMDLKHNEQESEKNR